MKTKRLELSSPMALPVHPHLSFPQWHALAGQPLTAVGVVRGRPVWPILGGSPEGDDDSAGGAGAGEGDGGQDDGAGGSDGGDDARRDGGNPDAKIKALEDEKDRHWRKRQEAEQELENLRKWKKEQEDKGKTELEKAQSDLQESVKERDALQSQVGQLQLEIAFLTDNTYSWQNPKRALQLADLSEVEIKDGKVKGLDKALEALAKSDPYLLKSKEDKGENDEGAGGPTGQQHNRKKGEKTGSDRNALMKKYPALRGR